VGAPGSPQAEVFRGIARAVSERLQDAAGPPLPVIR